VCLHWIALVRVLGALSALGSPLRSWCSWSPWSPWRPLTGAVTLARKRVEWTDLEWSTFKAHNKDADYECDEVDDHDTVDTVDVTKHRDLPTELVGIHESAIVTEWETLAYDPVVAAQIAFVTAASKRMGRTRSLAPRAEFALDERRLGVSAAPKSRGPSTVAWRPRTSGSLFYFRRGSLDIVIFVVIFITYIPFGGRRLKSYGTKKNLEPEFFLNVFFRIFFSQKTINFY
jgi:hypothetical protein